MRTFLGYLASFSLLAGCSTDDFQSTADAAPDGSSESGVADVGVDVAVPDAGRDVADASGPWEPSQLKGLALWLDGDFATANVNGTVDQWKDRSPNGNDAKTSTNAQKPVLLTGGSSINGHKALRFDGASKFFTIADSASLQWKQSFVLESVFRHATPVASEDGPIFAKQTGKVLTNERGPSLLIASEISAPQVSFVAFVAGGGLGFVETDRNAGFSSDVPHRVRATWDQSTTTMSIQIDKDPPVSAIKANVTGLDATGHDALVGVDLNNFFLKADLAEIVAVAGSTIDVGEITKLQTYLDTKYGL